MEEGIAREFYVKMKVVQEHIEQLDKHMEEIDEKTVELRGMIDAVKEAQQIKEGDEILVPLANGIFLPVQASKLEKLYLNVGAKTNITRTPENTIEILEKQQQELTQYREKVREQQMQLTKEAEKIEEAVMKAASGNV